jgi:ABC-type branched-subunit amino acid transport system substrate-binding protein
MLKTIQFILVSCIYLASSANSTHYHPPDHFNLAGVSPIVDEDGEVLATGIAIQHAIILALRQLNDKYDGIGDDVLPSSTLRASLMWALPYFEDGVQVAQDQIDGFGSEKIMGCIGPAKYDVIYGASRVYKDNHVSVMGYDDRHSSLGLSDIFSNTLRTVPGNYIDGRLLADLVEQLHWERVGVFSTSDTYGNLAKFFFEQEAKKKGLDILANIHFSPATEDFSEYLLHAKHMGVQIFVLLMHGTSAGRLMQQGYAMKVFNSHTQLLGGEQASHIDQWTGVDPELPSIVSGYLGIKYHTMPEISDAKLAFIDQFRSQESTLGDGSACNNATDDVGNYLYQVDHDNNPATSHVCTGLNFSSFKTDGSDIPPAAYHAYDAVFAMAHALHSLAYTNEVEFINGEIVREELLQRVIFTGATGTVKFSSQFLDDGFDVGTRNFGLTFDVLNYDQTFMSPEFKSVGTLRSDTGLALCSDCTVFFAGSSTDKPLDRPDPHSEHISSPLLSVIIIMSSISLLAVLAVALMFYVYRSTRLIKASQPEVGYVILSGCAMGSIRSLTAIAKPSSALCMSQMWLGHLAFTIVFCALLVKTWKVHKVMNQTMKRVKISTNTTLKIIAASCIPVFVYLLFVSTLGYVRKGSIRVYEDQHEIIYEEYCHFEHHDALEGLYIIELLAMIYGLYLCFLIRHVPDGISNSKSIAEGESQTITIRIILVKLHLFIFLFVSRHVHMRSLGDLHLSALLRGLQPQHQQDTHLRHFLHLHDTDPRQALPRHAGHFAHGQRHDEGLHHREGPTPQHPRPVERHRPRSCGARHEEAGGRAGPARGCPQLQPQGLRLDAAPQEGHYGGAGGAAGRAGGAHAERDVLPHQLRSLYLWGRFLCGTIHQG